MNPALDAATGALHIAARGTPAGLVAVEVRNTRPAAAHALRGLEVAQACARVPRLYSLCAHAQAGAARAACAAATVPAAPPRFSTTIGWPSDWLIFAPTVRATMSFAPPAG